LNESKGNRKYLKSLTAQHWAFIDAYILDPTNNTAAAIKAGFSAKTANSIACRLISDPLISAEIKKRMEARSKRVDIDADWVLLEARKVYERCMQEIEPALDRRGNPILIENNKGELCPAYTFDAKAALMALALIGKHVNVGAFKDDMSGDKKELRIIIENDPDKTE
jgi:phage terminase small subunit